ncbi:hypothetical protein EBZ80_17025 [bacterium]|nr:hypothetical protein [bacterium]
MPQNPWDNDPIVTPAQSRGGVFTLPADPEKQANSAREDARLRIAMQEEARRAAEYNATHNSDGSPKDPAAQVGIPPEQMHVTGPDFLKLLPPSEAAQVKALAEGRMAFPAGKAASSPYWQQRLAQVSQYDPEFDAINYNARAATRRDFTAGKSSANIKALNTAIGHLGELYGQIDNTASHGGFPGATAVNAIQNAFARSSGSSGPTKYEQTAGALAGELTQVYRQSGGAEADIQRYLTELSPNASLEQKREAIKNMANLLRSRLDAINDQYTKGMGTTAQPLQVLDPHAQQVLGIINGGGNAPPPGGRIPGSDANAPLINAQGQSYSTPQDMALAKAVGDAYRNGGDLNALFNAAKANGYTPTLQDAKAWQEAINSRSKGNPAGVLPRKSGTRSVAGQMFGQSLDDPGTIGGITRGVTAAGIGAGNAMTFGGLDELTGRVNSMAGGGGYEASRDYANLGKNAISDVAPLSYLGGEAVGALTQGLLGGAALGRLAPGVAAKALPALRTTPGAMATGAGYGAAYGAGENNQDRLGGAIGGAVLGAGGGFAGAKIAAPLARKFFETDAGQMLSNNARALLNKVRPDTVEPTGNVPQFTPGERVLPQMDQLPGLTDKLRTAADLNLPYTLADAHPKLRNLAGRQSRISPDARSSAEQFLEPRALGQADRAREGINKYLAPVFPGSLDQESAALINAGKPIYQPLYHAAYQAPPITSPIIEGTLSSPFGREALGKASRDIANDMSSTRGLGFALDEMGNPVLNKVPVKQMDSLTVARDAWDQANQAYQNAVARRSASLTPGAFSKEVQAAEQALRDASANLDTAKMGMVQAPRSGTVADASGYTTQALDYTHRGMNDILQNPSYTNQLTGRLNNSGRIAKQAQERFAGEIDRFNPAYGEARGAYSKFAKQAEGLKTGYEVLPSDRLPSGDFNAILGNARAYDSALPPQFSEQTVFPQMQRGYATSMADRVGRARLSTNPYNSIYGSTNQQQRVGQLFPEGADKFSTLYNLEGDMAKTRGEVLGGSPTAARQQADASFMDSGLGNAAEMAGQLATGGGLSPTGLIRLAKQFAGVRAKLGLRKGVETRANDVAAQLLNPNPSGLLDYIGELMQRQAAQKAREGNFRMRGGLFGGAVVPLLESGQ